MNDNRGTQTVQVALGDRSYPIQIGAGNLAEVGPLLDKAGVRHAVIITDENVEKPYGRTAAESLGERLQKVDLVVIAPGEASKSIDTARALWEGLVELGTDRKSCIVAVGGGVVGDLAGFVAATYARGISFFQVPTSLLAQVDSSVGGKVGIDLPSAKNMVGAFLQPRGVLIDVQTLQTLPEREYRAGFGEVVKYGVILDADLFVELEKQVAALRRRDPQVLSGIVARCCRLKADIVEKDEREETGLRAILNYGHTFAHAVETLTGYSSILHGEAVAVGMIAASRLAERLGRIDADLTPRQQDLLEALGLETNWPDLPLDEVLAAMARDKKAARGRLRFVLPSRLGQVELVEVDPADVRASLAARDE